MQKGTPLLTGTPAGRLTGTPAGRLMGTPLRQECIPADNMTFGSPSVHYLNVPGQIPFMKSRQAMMYSPVHSHTYSLMLLLNVQKDW